MDDEHGGWRALAIQLLKQMLFRRKTFGDRFDDDVIANQIAQFNRAVNARQRPLNSRFAQCAAHRFAFEKRRAFLKRGLQFLMRDVAGLHLVAS